MAQLANHPAIVSVYQAGTTLDGRPFLVMGHCPPPHLAARMRHKPLSVGKALDVTIQPCGAVETAHRLGILHRDIKLANILFTGRSVEHTPELQQLMRHPYAVCCLE